MKKEWIFGTAAVVGLSAMINISIEGWQKGDEIGRELDARVTQALPSTYSPEELLGYRLVTQQYSRAVADGNIQAVEDMRASGEIDIARINVENNQILLAERGRLRIELGREDSGILGISKAWMQLIGRLPLALSSSLIIAGVVSFFASRQTGPNNPSFEQVVPGVFVNRQ